jgi:ribosome-binding protein aMBF1 (putative translation factor)
MDKKQLGQEIARQRKAKGMSQWTLANETGINRSVISYIESGYVLPSGEQLRAIEKALGKRLEAVPA